MAVVLYSTTWTGDLALGEAIVELLKQELSKRKVVFRVVERRWDDLQFGRLLSAEEGAGLMVEVEVEEKDRQVGEECLEAVYSDGRKLKEKALHVARTKYIKDDHELEEYRRGLEETYGW
ncbi:MAG: hypothetical protein NZ570_01210 [Candidatus Caldarchaeum sp.]|nr:hypothetical protein [Candidatus Caldarchaeum sp.]MDW7978072.1 hypothetical protein [Candidatus Caldarchaeum sp.]MDW8360089.1 hypothetical protein [Candidatus Caldarchaeum sp.]